eukprot:9343252-Ditylum_brightwellii.AAC.1
MAVAMASAMNSNTNQPSRHLRGLGKQSSSAKASIHKDNVDNDANTVLWRKLDTATDNYSTTTTTDDMFFDIGYTCNIDGKMEIIE